MTRRLKKYIAIFLLFFYRRLCRRYLTFQVYSYLAIGVFNTVFNVAAFSLLYYLVFDPMSQSGYLPDFFEPHSVALGFAFCISMPPGFWLTRNFTFRKGTSSRSRQFTKYGYVLVQGLFLEYLILRLFIEVFRVEPTLSKLCASAIVATLNYFLQRHFTFRRTRKK